MPSTPNTAALLLALLGVGPALAVYRCGNSFQDRPCANGEAEVRISPSGRRITDPTAPMPSAKAATANDAPSASPFVTVCTRMGQDAQRVSWKREAGATQERQLAELPNNGGREEMSKIIASVYSRRGSAPEIRAAIEAECYAEKQKQADAAAAAGKTTKDPSSPAAATPLPTTPGGADPTAPVKAAAQARPPSERVECLRYRSQEEQVAKKMRAGGSATQMEQYQNERRSVEKSLKDAKCT